MAKEIQLTQGKVAIVDDDDFELLNKWKWCFHKRENRNTGYAVRNERSADGKDRTVPMHRSIMNLHFSDTKEVDHRNGNGCDNQRKNLRVCSRQENQCNGVLPVNNKSGFRGVFWVKENLKWRAKISYRNRTIYLGSFSDKALAAHAYNEAARKYHGEFARFNEVI